MAKAKEKAETGNDDWKSTWINEVREQEKAVARAEEEWRAAKAEASELKKEFEAETEKLSKLIRGGPDREGKLAFGDKIVWSKKTISDFAAGLDKPTKEALGTMLDDKPMQNVGELAAAFDDSETDLGTWFNDQMVNKIKQGIDFFKKEFPEPTAN